VGIFGRRRGRDDDELVEGDYSGQGESYYAEDEDVAAETDTDAEDFVDDYDDYDDDEDDEDGGQYDGDGPFDDSEAPQDDVARLDLGSVRLPMPTQSQIQVEMDPAGPLRAVHVVTEAGRYTVSAYAAPRTGALWPEISRELAEQLHRDGARVRKEHGEWGIELVAFVNDVLLRFVGVDGPRWMLRAVAAGPKETSAKAAEELRDMVRDTVVIRGESPMPVRTPLQLTLPEEIANHIEATQAAQQQAAQRG
jgi:hypothetical protein